MKMQLVYRVQLDDEQFDNLKFYTGIKDADNFISPREDAINHLYFFLTNNELEYVKENDCIDYVIFCKE